MLAHTKHVFMDLLLSNPTIAVLGSSACKVTGRKQGVSVDETNTLCNEELQNGVKTYSHIPLFPHHMGPRHIRDRPLNRYM